MKRILIIFLTLFMVQSLYAQRPKLHIKAHAGYNNHIFIYRAEEIQRDFFSGWQAGFGFRVTKKKFMFETDFNFLRSAVLVALPDSVATENFDGFEFKLKSFELPVKLGYVPIKTPLFKWYAFAGFGIRLNTKSTLEVAGQKIKFYPKDVGLRNPNIDFIMGSQVDIGWLNLELLYGIGVTNSLKENIRTNSHELQLTAGILF